MTRRTALKWAIHSAGFVGAAVVAIPSLLTGLSPALRGRGPLWRSIGALEGFPVGTTRKALVDRFTDSWPAPVTPQAVYVWRVSAEEVVVFSRSCTDLGCPVTHDPGSGVFFCPCHGGIFAQDGERMAGPPPRPLYRYATRVRDGVVEIDLRSAPPVA
jgi:menaquinol-cytochrome c reductase iron-sulfur subunit